MAKNYWLIKSEPSSWSWDQQVKAGAKGTSWDGVRNHVAKKNLMAMQKGDLCFFYHSNDGKNIVGIVEVIKEHFLDPTAEKNEPWVSVQVKAIKAAPKAVSLADVKATPKLAKMSLLTSARLSVQPVTAQEWEIISKMAGI